MELSLAIIGAMKKAGLKIHPLNVLLIFVPIAAVLELLHAGAVWIFLSSCLAIIPLAGIMGSATEKLAERAGSGIGGLLNATFGNAAELIIAIVAMNRGLHSVVKASLTGSIIGNVLLVLGVSILAGGLKYSRQTFNATAASMGATLMALSAIGLVIPDVYHLIAGAEARIHEQDMSMLIALVLIVTYGLSLIFSLRTHKYLYVGKAEESHDTNPQEGIWKPVLILLAATAGVAIMSEFLVGAVEATATTLGMSDIFVGVIIVAVIGNAAEHSTAVMVATKDKMELALNIAIGSSIQIALFVAPVLVFLSHAIGKPMDLLFTNLEVIAIGVSVWILSLVCNDGESNWMEGVQLLAVYLILAVAFYFL
jgi:Ca2+:H+ antiporter